MNKVFELWKKKVQRTSHRKRSKDPKKISEIHFSDEFYKKDHSPRRSSVGTLSTASVTADSTSDNHEESDTHHLSSDFTIVNVTNKIHTRRLDMKKKHEERMESLRESHGMIVVHGNPSQISEYEPKESKNDKDEEEDEDEVDPWTESDKYSHWEEACGKICSLEGLQYQDNTCNGVYPFLTVKKHLLGIHFKTLQNISERNVDFFEDTHALKLFAQVKYGWQGPDPRFTEVLPGQKRTRTQKIDLCAQEEQDKEKLREYAKLSVWRKELEAKTLKRKKAKLDKDDINVKASLSNISKSTNEAFTPQRKELEAKTLKRKKAKLDKDGINVKASLSNVSKSTNEAFTPQRKELEAKTLKRKKAKLDKDGINVKASLSNVSKSTNEAFTPLVQTSTRSSSKTKITSLRSKVNQKRNTSIEKNHRKKNIKKTTNEATKTTSEPIKRTSTIPVVKNKPVRNVSNDTESVSTPTEATKKMANLALLSKQRKEAVNKYTNSNNALLKDLLLKSLVNVGKRIDGFNQSLVATCNEKREFEMVSEVLTILVHQREELEQMIEANYQKEDLCVTLMKQLDKVEQRIDSANKALV